MTLPNDTIPYGYCQCGCGAKTRISERTHAGHGYVKGEPQRFLPGHSARTRRVFDLDRPETGYDIDPSTGCYVWKRTMGAEGYGQLFDRRRWRAHVWFWVRENGPVPDGYVIHHTCKNKRCVNPAHLVAMDEIDHLKLHAPDTPHPSLGRWARKYDACRGCGRSDRPHCGHGLCGPCTKREAFVSTKAMRPCVICGREALIQSNHKTCSATCKAEHERRRNAVWMRQKRDRLRAESRT